MNRKYSFKQVVLPKEGFLRGPFGGDLKKEIFVQKGNDTYKVYEQGVVLNSDKSLGRYNISQKDYKAKLHKFSIQDKDFLVSCSGVNMGAIYQIREPFERGIINQALLRIRLNNELIDDNYFFYLFKELISKKIISGSGDSTIPNFPGLDLIKNIEVELPSKNIQLKVGKILKNIDAKIEHNDRINAELEAMAKTLYDYWFVQFDFPNEQGAPYKTSGGKMVWNEQLKRRIPEEWRDGTLLDIANYENGIPCQKYKPIGKDSLKVIKIREMNEGFSSNTELVRPDIPFKAIIESGDILFSWSASLDVKIWTGGKGALNQHIFKVTSDYYPKSFYYFQLLNYLQHFKMMAENRKTTMGHITQEHLHQSRIVIPPRELTLQLERIISPIFDKIVNNKIQNQHLSSLRDWLLPMLMNGQATVGGKEADVYKMEEAVRMAAEPGGESPKAGKAEVWE
jgi:type I restriction enzyme, S subunit